MKVFLGGTYNGSTWRDKLIKDLKIAYLNPVVNDWAPDCMKEELLQKELCDYCLYVITPNMTGVYSIAEVVDDSNKYPEKTILCVLEIDDDIAFNQVQLKSLTAVSNMIKSNGAICFTNLKETIEYLNGNKSL